MLGRWCLRRNLDSSEIPEKKDNTFESFLDSNSQLYTNIGFTSSINVFVATFVPINVCSR